MNTRIQRRCTRGGIRQRCLGSLGAPFHIHRETVLILILILNIQQKLSTTTQTAELIIHMMKDHKFSLEGKMMIRELGAEAARGTTTRSRGLSMKVRPLLHDPVITQYRNVNSIGDGFDRAPRPGRTPTFVDQWNRRHEWERSQEKHERSFKIPRTQNHRESGTSNGQFGRDRETHPPSSGASPAQTWYRIKQTIAMRARKRTGEVEDGWVDKMSGTWYVYLPYSSLDQPVLEARVHWVEGGLTFDCYRVDDEGRPILGARGPPAWLLNRPKERLFFLEMELWFDGYRFSAQDPPTS